MKKEEILKKEIAYYSRVYNINCKRVLELKKRLVLLKKKTIDNDNQS